MIASPTGYVMTLLMLTYSDFLKVVECFGGFSRGPMAFDGSSLFVNSFQWWRGLESSRLRLRSPEFSAVVPHCVASIMLILYTT